MATVFAFKALELWAPKKCGRTSKRSLQVITLAIMHNYSIWPLFLARSSWPIPNTTTGYEYPMNTLWIPCYKYPTEYPQRSENGGTVFFLLKLTRTRGPTEELTWTSSLWRVQIEVQITSITPNDQVLWFPKVLIVSIDFGVEILTLCDFTSGVTSERKPQQRLGLSGKRWENDGLESESLWVSVASFSYDSQLRVSISSLSCKSQLWVSVAIFCEAGQTKAGRRRSGVQSVL